MRRGRSEGLDEGRKVQSDLRMLGPWRREDFREGMFAALTDEIRGVM